MYSWTSPAPAGADLIPDDWGHGFRCAAPVATSRGPFGAGMVHRVRPAWAVMHPPQRVGSPAESQLHIHTWPPRSARSLVADLVCRRPLSVTGARHSAQTSGDRLPQQFLPARIGIAQLRAETPLSKHRTGVLQPLMGLGEFRGNAICWFHLSLDRAETGCHSLLSGLGDGHRASTNLRDGQNGASGAEQDWRGRTSERCPLVPKPFTPTPSTRAHAGSGFPPVCQLMFIVPFTGRGFVPLTVGVSG